MSDTPDDAGTIKSGSGLLRLGSAKPQGLNSLLLVAVQDGDAEAVVRALADGADPNFQDPRTGATALHYAAAYRAHRCLAPIIRSRRCNYLIQDKRGLLPSEVAFEVADDPRVGGLLAKLEARQAHRTGRGSWRATSS